jgi:hypothetical protein
MVTLQVAVVVPNHSMRLKGVTKESAHNNQVTSPAFHTINERRKVQNLDVF